MSKSTHKLIGVALGAVILCAVSVAAGFWIARHETSKATGKASGSATGNATSLERKPLYWYDPMQPDQHFDKPGKSPFMDMQLIPRYAAEAGSGEPSSLQIDPRIVQNLGVRLTSVEQGPLLKGLEAVGTLGFNQRDFAVIQARANGFVTRTYARAPGDVVDRDAPIVDLLVPEWAGAQTEFLALLKSGDPDLIAAGRQRLVLLGMRPELIATIESRREQQPTLTVRSPFAGVIESLDAREGMAITAGATLVKIDGITSVWLEAGIPEAQGSLMPLGKTVEVRLTAYPGETFKGRVIAVLPEANAQTRTLRMRIELANPDGRLRPGMFAQVRLDVGSEVPVLYVASEAIIHTGRRAVVIVANDTGGFVPTEVQTGGDRDGKTVILGGLKEGERVVASGQFLIDSEASLKGVLARLSGSPQ